MRRANVRRSWGGVLGGLVAFATVTVVVGAPIVGSGPFSMPSAGAPPKDIWTGPPSTRSGSKVKATSGVVRVEGTVAGVVKPLGQISVGVECVFEGKYDKVSIVGVTFPAAGTYEVRAPTDGTSGDRLVGSGSVAFAAQGGSLGIYASDEPLRRLAAVTPAGAGVAIRSTRTGSDLVAIDAGDWSFAIVGTASAYYLAATTTATAAFAIQDVRTACGPFSGTSHGRNGETDAVYVDGTCPLNLSLSNAGPGTVRVTRQVVGQAPATVDVAPGTATAGAGALVRFDWEYVDPNPTNVTTVTLTATVQ